MILENSGFFAIPFFLYILFSSCFVFFSIHIYILYIYLLPATNCSFSIPVDRRKTSIEYSASMFCVCEEFFLRSFLCFLLFNAIKELVFFLLSSLVRSCSKINNDKYEKENEIRMQTYVHITDQTLLLVFLLNTIRSLSDS